jgi:P pilus assembly chaperone PapD
VKKVSYSLALTLMGTFVAQSAWACSVPATPRSIPDGQKAEAQVMVQAKRTVEQYLQQVSTYASCEKDALKLQEVVATQKLVMDRFNAEVRAFNEQARAIKAVSR